MEEPPEMWQCDPDVVAEHSRFQMQHQPVDFKSLGEQGLWTFPSQANTWPPLSL